MKIFTKQPGERLAYDIDLTDWFQGLIDSDQIDGATLQVVLATAGSTADLTASLNATFLGTPPTVIKVWIEAGIDGADYKLTVRATTAQGRVKEVDFIVRIKEI
jgi:hypothetical protein